MTGTEWLLASVALAAWAYGEVRYHLLLANFAAERRLWTVERQGLCDRVQGSQPQVVIQERVREVGTGAGADDTENEPEQPPRMEFDPVAVRRSAQVFADGRQDWLGE